MTSVSPRRIADASAVSILLALALALPGRMARADVPDPPAPSAFHITARCLGETVLDPGNDPNGAVPDLTLVFGGRLATYNAGGVVATYDDYGSQDPGAYPPLCGTRYVAAVGHDVSEWMYCTDRSSKVCGGTSVDGDPLDELSESEGGEQVAVAPVRPLSGPNPKLTPDQERLIAFLIQHGHSYEGIGDQSFDGAPTAVDGASSATFTRAALQTLIWCVSDPAVAGENDDFAATCEHNMDAAEQARMLALIPDTPTLAIDLADPAPTAEIGDVVRFTLTSNLYAAPITVTGDQGSLELCPGEADATLVGDALTIPGTDASIATVVDLCLTVTSAALTTVTASGTPPSTSHISWSQSAGGMRQSGLAISCQVFANFSDVQRTVISDRASVTVEAAATTTTAAATSTTAAATTSTAVVTAPTGSGGGAAPAPQPATTSTVSSTVGGGAPIFTGQLPRTGTSTTPGLAMAAASTALGALARVLVRRRRPDVTARESDASWRSPLR